jgi:serine phosphatase RsbU (regulator of sigma subunit)
VFAFVRQAAREVAKVHQGLLLMELRAARSVLDSELSLARDMQSGLAPAVPAEVGAGLDLAVHYKPVMWVGGDYCDIWPADPAHLALAVGHVDAIGLPAALFLHSLRLALRFAVDPARSLPDALNQVDRQLLAHPLHKTSASLFLGLLDRSKGVLRFVNAAHPQPLALLHSGWTTLGQSDATRLGTGGATFHEHSLAMQNLVSLLLYTPGITHTRSPHADDFGAIGLLRALKSARTDSAQATVHAVTDAAEGHRRSLARMHDLTVLALALAPGKESRED